MTSISSHVLDTSSGLPAAGVRVALYQRLSGGEWSLLAERTTNADGRVPSFVEPSAVSAYSSALDYRLVFDVGSYFAARSQPVFFPEVQVSFRILEPSRHHHVPLLLSPFGYSTYRGS